ncbi:MAG: CYTH domain-containing protein, partial [Acidobacteriota bacterium]
DMGIEIERKFLVSGDGWRGQAHKSTRLRQGYLSTDSMRNVRVRIKGDRALLTVKGKMEADSFVKRLEFEYDIPMDDALELLKLCLDSPIDKTRHEVHRGGHLWEVDEFYGQNEGLIVAEIELESVDTAFERPEWIGEEVSDDARYLNSNLVARPYSTW